MTLKTQERRFSACYRHPAEPVTGFCASCLRERLAGLDPSGQPEPSSSTSTTVTATAFVSSFKESGGGGAGVTSRRSKAAVASSSFSPEFRRSKSVTAGKCEASSSLSEPRRKSCDVRVRNTLAHLFDIDDEKGGLNIGLKVESKNLGLSRLTGPVFESREDDGNRAEIRVSDDVTVPNVNDYGEVEEEFKTMKEHIDLEWQSRKQTVRDFRDIAGSFWVAASVFNKKLRKWRQKQKMKKHSGGDGGGVGSGNLLGMRSERSTGGPLRDTQSEIGDYGFGRRSCDTEPRFSVDAGRMSLDDSRFSLDEPRASWDGYLIARTIPRLTPMLSVVENVMLAPSTRSGNHRISIDGQMHSINDDDTTSGGSTQTKDDYSDSSSSQRRSSFDRSSSVKSSSKKTLGLDVDEGKSVSNAKVSPATADIFQGTKLVFTERELKDWHLDSLKDNNSDSFESVSKDATSVNTSGNLNGFKKSGRWRKVCNIWGFRHRYSDNKSENVSENVMDRPVTEPSEKRSREADGELKGASSGTLIRSASCVSPRNSCTMIESYHRMRSVGEARGCTKQGREELVLEHNRSAGYSPSNSDSGLLRFYLTPLRSSRRNKSGKSRLQNSHSVAGNVLRLN